MFESDGGIYVFDMKYKRFDFLRRCQAQGSVAYIRGNEAAVKRCGFVFPILQEEWAAHGRGAFQM